ncbi:hypothetical protein PIB30_048213 [Stylosanthes scabra]|uniref:Uncharacterized protein n=1 Tax=Stylosanthes scabra TaxID=79078 RepID=A0ABU6SH80_9FABA|nr:hypothetical protein [Stylosanthes scabra]
MSFRLQFFYHTSHRTQVFINLKSFKKTPAKNHSLHSQFQEDSSLIKVKKIIFFISLFVVFCCSSDCFLTTPPPPIASSPSDEFVAPNRAFISLLTRRHAPPEVSVFIIFKSVLQIVQPPSDPSSSTLQIVPCSQSSLLLQKTQQPLDSSFDQRSRSWHASSSRSTPQTSPRHRSLPHPYLQPEAAPWHSKPPPPGPEIHGPTR